MKTTGYKLKNAFIILLLSAGVYGAKAQEQAAATASPNPVETSVKVPTKSDAETKVMPRFHGGNAALANYIQTNIRYPQQALSQDKEARLLVGFSVDENGKVSNVVELGD